VVLLHDLLLVIVSLEILDFVGVALVTLPHLADKLFCFFLLFFFSLLLFFFDDLPVRFGQLLGHFSYEMFVPVRDCFFAVASFTVIITTVIFTATVPLNVFNVLFFTNITIPFLLVPLWNLIRFEELLFFFFTKFFFTLCDDFLQNIVVWLFFHDFLERWVVRRQVQQQALALSLLDVLVILRIKVAHQTPQFTQFLFGLLLVALDSFLFLFIDPFRFLRLHLRLDVLLEVHQILLST